MKRKLSILTMFLALFTCLSYGQKNKHIQKQHGLTSISMTEENSQNTLVNSSPKELFKDLIGTFQIQVSDSKYNVLLNQNIYNLIQENRQPYKDVLLTIDDKSVLYLPSMNKIKKHDFISLKPSIYKLTN
jgi:hypothetical protein